jgi:hypothetical protein
MKITVDLKEVKLIAGKADKLLVSRETENELAKLLSLRDEIENAITEAQSLIEQEGLKLNPSFKSVEGDLVKASYRSYGQKYYLAEDRINEVPTEFYVKEVVTKYKVNTKTVETWAEKNNGLPLGIIAPERKKSLKITLKKNDASEN